MAENWKPGDLGSIDTRGDDARVMFTGYHWVSASGMLLNPHLVPRPLVVIDPEDRDQVADLIEAVLAHGYEFSIWALSDMRAALREFANPTPQKHEEPTGLGAVVEDERGERWTRIEGNELRPWHRGGNFAQEWSVLKVVRVLSEGVTS